MIKNSFRNVPSWSFWDDLFTADELKKLIDQCAQLKLTEW